MYKFIGVLFFLGVLSSSVLAETTFFEGENLQFVIEPSVINASENVSSVSETIQGFCGDGVCGDYENVDSCIEDCGGGSTGVNVAIDSDLDSSVDVEIAVEERGVDGEVVATGSYFRYVSLGILVLLFFILWRLVRR